LKGKGSDRFQEEDQIPSDIKVEIEQPRNMDTATDTVAPSGLLALFQRRLINQGVDRDYIQHLIEANRGTLSDAILDNPIRLEKFIQNQLLASMRQSEGNMAVLNSRVITLVGATGSGKTSTCAKLAAFYAVTLGKKVAWISADTIRTAAISEANTYAEILGIPITFVYSPQELSSALEENKAMDLILVDTTGINPMDEDQVLTLGTYLTLLPARSVYLVASATMKDSDLIQTARTFSPFNLRGLVMTKLDETTSYGSLFNLAANSKLPIAFFTEGQNIFGNLRPGQANNLIEMLFNEDRT
jgi:flagellar biosynthesis protein FlhF